MLILRIRQAETALADGRLDEAFGLAQAADVWAHHKGQRLIGRLARALVTRAGEHLAGGRHEQAAHDCDKAAALAGNLPELAELRSSLAKASTQQRQLERRRGDVLAAAREHLENGRLSLGEECLADADDRSARVAALRNQAVGRRAQAEAALERARQSLEREDFPAAAQALLEARNAHPTDPKSSEMTARLVHGACARAGAAIDAGRLDLADAILGPVLRSAGESIEIRELSWFVDGCREALSGFLAGQPRSAAETLRRLAAVRPTAAWLPHALQAAQEAAERLETLRSGPLGLLNPPAGAGCPERKPPAVQERPVRSPSPPREPSSHDPLPPRLLLHVDGVGSFLVLRERRVTIGPAGSSRHPELALLAEPGMPGAVIERTDDDYFLSSETGVCVNDSPAKRRLLNNGDRISLSPRARARFLLPNAASTTAVLQLSGTRLPSCDARQVILLDRELILGPGPSAHIRADALGEPAILQVHDGRLVCRSKEHVLVNDRPMDRHEGLSPGTRVRIGGVSLVLTTV